LAKKLTIVIPAFNEAQILGSVLNQIKAACFNIAEEIIVVDDGSTDETVQVANQAGVSVISHGRNRGYGASLKTGIRNAKTEFVLTFDADNQHRAEDILRFWELAQDYDMVVGKRVNLLNSPLWRLPGKWIIGLMANYLVQYKIPDLNSGFRIMKRDVVLKYVHLCPAGFSFSTTITMAMFSRGCRVKYLPITVNVRKGKSRVNVSTGFDTIVLVLRIATLFNPLRIFIPASLFIGTIGVFWAIPYIVVGRGISIGSMLAIFTSIMLFGLGLTCDQISQLRMERFE
jgi:glycosyltransferase involved in cell wall biosynthesis